MRCLALALAAFLAAPATAQDADRIVSVGGAVTEIVYALGEAHRLVARDTTSTFPAEAEDLPDVGYMRQLSAEGVLSVDPGLILIEEGAGPPETLELLRAASIPLATIPVAVDAGGILARIDAVAQALGVPEKGAALHGEVGAALDAARDAAARAEPRRVLFILSTAGGRITAAGEGTGADGIIRMAGGVNAMTGFQGYKQVSDEAVMAAAPEVVLMMDREGDHATADDTLFAMPAIASTPAARTRSVVRMDGLLMLGFGPRTAEAVSRLSAAFAGAGQ